MVKRTVAAAAAAAASIRKLHLAKIREMQREVEREESSARNP